LCAPPGFSKKKSDNNDLKGSKGYVLWGKIKKTVVMAVFIYLLYRCITIIVPVYYTVDVCECFIFEVKFLK